MTEDLRARIAESIYGALYHLAHSDSTGTGPVTPDQLSDAGLAEAELDQLKATLAQHEGLLASIALYISWRSVTRSLTTEQKELFADSIERHAVRLHGPDGDDPDPEAAGLPSYTPRWWRPKAAPDQPEEGL